MTRRHHVFRRLFYLLLTTMLSVCLGTTRAAAADAGYPPPPGAYRSESQMPRTGLLPLPADTFSASDTADILFGSLPTLKPSTAPAPGHQQPAPPYDPGYQAYPSQYENQSSGYAPSGGYAAPYPTSEPYAMPATSDPVPDAARYAPKDAMQGYPAAIEMRDLPDGPPTGAPEAAARDIFRPAE